jgi:hypothetical protein
VQYGLQILPVRLLEAHMSYLRQSFREWKFTQPDEPESDNPTEAEKLQFEEAEKNHQGKVI